MMITQEGLESLCMLLLFFLVFGFIVMVSDGVSVLW